jgi:hypothetical protein
VAPTTVATTAILKGDEDRSGVFGSQWLDQERLPRSSYGDEDVLSLYFLNARTRVATTTILAGDEDAGQERNPRISTGDNQGDP